MNDQLSDDIKKKFMLLLTTELHDPKKKVFHNAPFSPTNKAYYNVFGKVMILTANASKLTEKYFSQNKKNKLTEKNFLVLSAKKFDLN